jgi:hypothetical protein
LRAPKAAISVGHTKVKSFGQKNTIFHLPATGAVETSVNAVLMSFDTTALSVSSGNLLPIPSMRHLLLVRMY